MIWPNFLDKMAVTIPSSDLGLPNLQANDTTLHIVLNMVFVFIGAFSTIFLLVGAIRYVVSAGNAGNITQAKNTIIYAAVGLGISVLAFTIVQFVLGKIG